MRRIRKNDKWNEVRRFSATFHAAILTRRFYSFTASRSDELQKHKLETLRSLNDFNDVTIAEGSTLASLKMRRMTVAKSLLGRLGESVNIEQPFFVGWGCNIFIGDDVYINRELVDVSLICYSLLRLMHYPLTKFHGSLEYPSSTTLLFESMIAFLSDPAYVSARVRINPMQRAGGKIEEHLLLAQLLSKQIVGLVPELRSWTAFVLEQERPLQPELW